MAGSLGILGQSIGTLEPSEGEKGASATCGEIDVSRGASPRWMALELYMISFYTLYYQLESK